MSGSWTIVTLLGTNTNGDHSALNMLQLISSLTTLRKPKLCLSLVRPKCTSVCRLLSSIDLPFGLRQYCNVPPILSYLWRNSSISVLVKCGAIHVPVDVSSLHFIFDIILIATVNYPNPASRVLSCEPWPTCFKLFSCGQDPWFFYMVMPIVLYKWTAAMDEPCRQEEAKQVENL